MQLNPRNCLLLAAAAMVLQIGIVSSAQADLIGYWPFDEVEEVNGERRTPDISPGGGHDGVLSDTAEFTPDGRFGGAIDFGEFNNQAVVRLPTFPQDDRTDAGYNPDLGPGFTAIAGREADPEIVGSQEATISFWQNRGDNPATNQVTYSFDDGGTRQMRSHAPWSNGLVYYDVAGCCGGNQRIATSMNGADTDGEWHHLAYVKKKNPEESEMAITAIFQDGVPLVSSPGCDLDCWAAGALDDGSFPVDWPAATIDDVISITLAAIGDDPTTGTESQNGMIDEFAIWDEALSVDRIVNLAAGGGVIPIPEGEELGDFNSDGVIDSLDFLIIAENFNTKSTLAEAFFKGDMDGNLRIDLKDFLAFRGLVESLPAGAAAVPEPGMGTLMGIAAFSLLVWRRRFY